MSNLSQNDRKKLDNFNSMTVGNIFQKTREEKGATVMQVSEHLNIGSSHIEAIESNDINHLPPKVYAVGFVRAYADLLGLDSEKMVYLFKVQVYGKHLTDQQKHIVNTSNKDINFLDVLKANKATIPIVVGVFVIIGMVIYALGVLIVWILTSDYSDNEFRVPKVPIEMMEGAATPVDEFIISGEQELATPIEPMDIVIKPDIGGKSYGVNALESALTFKMLAEGWLEIRTVNGGKLLLSETLNAGDVFYASDAQDVLLTTNNAANIEAYLDGQRLGVIGADGDVVRLRPFSVRALRLQRAE